MGQTILSLQEPTRVIVLKSDLPFANTTIYFLSENKTSLSSNNITINIYESQVITTVVRTKCNSNNVVCVHSES